MTAAAGTAAAYGALWAATGTAAAGGALTGLHPVHVTAPRDALQASAATALELLIHNAVVALWPLALVLVGWPAIPVARLAGDAMVAGQLLLHGALVGDALSQHPQLWRYLPHLPFEWLALTAPAAGWLLARRGPCDRRRSLQLAATSIAALIAAAGLETWAVPL